MKSIYEKEADEAIEKAVRALEEAAAKAERAGYGDLIRTSLAEATSNAQYALDTAHDRT